MSRIRKVRVGVALAAESEAPPWPGVRWHAVSLVYPVQPCANSGTISNGTKGVPDRAYTVEDLELRPEDAVGYRVNLANGVPSLYVVLEDGPLASRSCAPPTLRLISASPFRVRALAETGTASIESLAMPPLLVKLIEQFADEHQNIDTPVGSVCALAAKLEERFFAGDADDLGRSGTPARVIALRSPQRQ
jgi:hypothetical protein